MSIKWKCRWLIIVAAIAGSSVGAETAWNPDLAGSAWLPMADGMNGSVNSMTVYGGRLIAGGGFVMAGSTTANRIAAWDGAQWQPLGSGADGGIHVITAYQNWLVVAGMFDSVGGVAADGLAKWNGTAWSAVANSPFVSVSRMIVYNNELIVAGTGLDTGAMEHIARWNGTTWSPLGPGLDSTIDALGVHDGRLVASGDLIWPATGRAIWTWNGSAWSLLEDQMNGIADTYASWNGDLIAAGRFTSIGGVSANRIARWDGTTWSPLAAGIGSALTNQRVEGLAVHGGELWAFGYFERAGGQPASHIARWDGTAWTSAGNNADYTADSGISHAGRLFVGGAFTTVDNIVVNFIAQRFEDSIFSNGFE